MQILNSTHLKKLTSLRHKLHQNPELSFEETITASIIKEWFKPLKPDRIIDKLGGEGLAFIYKGEKTGKNILFRCELDALPIQESTDLKYQSCNRGISHSCGHDGHMAIMASLGLLLSQERPPSGQVVLLFQPAEETGQGARQILKEKEFRSLKPDFVFAFHNLPGHPLGQILIRKDTFYCASTGIIIHLKGQPSHAAHPENGISPTTAVCELVSKLPRFTTRKELKDICSLITITHVKIGVPSLGITPGEAEIMATLRTESDADLARITTLFENRVLTTARKYNLKCNISRKEQFSATVNNSQVCNIIEQVSSQLSYSYKKLEYPLRVSEDFSEFTSRYPGAIFGIGAGENHPQLHNANYDFPDELIPLTSKLLVEIIHNILNSHL